MTAKTLAERSASYRQRKAERDLRMLVTLNEIANANLPDASERELWTRHKARLALRK